MPTDRATPRAASVYKVDAETGAVAWSVSLADSTGFPGDFARSAVSVAGDHVIVGNQAGRTGQGGAS